jgi:hypothetical protein
VFVRVIHECSCNTVVTSYYLMLFIVYYTHKLRPYTYLYSYTLIHYTVFRYPHIGYTSTLDYRRTSIASHLYAHACATPLSHDRTMLVSDFPLVTLDIRLQTTPAILVDTSRQHIKRNVLNEPLARTRSGLQSEQTFQATTPHTLDSTENTNVQRS